MQFAKWRVWTFIGGVVVIIAIAAHFVLTNNPTSEGWLFQIFSVIIAIAILFAVFLVQRPWFVRGVGIGILVTVWAVVCGLTVAGEPLTVSDREREQATAATSFTRYSIVRGCQVVEGTLQVNVIRGEGNGCRVQVSIERQYLNVYLGPGSYRNNYTNDAHFEVFGSSGTVWIYAYDPTSRGTVYRLPAPPSRDGYVVPKWGGA